MRFSCVTRDLKLNLQVHTKPHLYFIYIHYTKHETEAKTRLRSSCE